MINDKVGWEEYHPVLSVTTYQTITELRSNIPLAKLYDNSLIARRKNSQDDSQYHAPSILLEGKSKLIKLNNSQETSQYSLLSQINQFVNENLYIISHNSLDVRVSYASFNVITKKQSKKVVQQPTSEMCYMKHGDSYSLGYSEIFKYS